MMSFDTYRVTKSFSGNVYGAGSVHYGHYWLNVDDVFQVIERPRDEDGKPLVAVRTPGLVDLLVFSVRKTKRQAAEISGTDFKLVCRQLDLPIWQFGNPVTRQVELPWC